MQLAGKSSSVQRVFGSPGRISAPMSMELGERVPVVKWSTGNTCKPSKKSIWISYSIHKRYLAIGLVTMYFGSRYYHSTINQKHLLASVSICTMKPWPLFSTVMFLEKVCLSCSGLLRSCGSAFALLVSIRIGDCDEPVALRHERAQECGPTIRA